MTKMELDVYSDSPNQAVVTAPGRRFPGLVIQGDSLAILCSDLRDIATWVDQHAAADDEIRFAVQDVQEQFLNRLLHYQSVLQGCGIPLPYTSEACHGDLVKLVADVD